MDVHFSESKSLPPKLLPRYTQRITVTYISYYIAQQIKPLSAVSDGDLTVGETHGVSSFPLCFSFTFGVKR